MKRQRKKATRNRTIGRVPVHREFVRDRLKREAAEREALVKSSLYIPTTEETVIVNSVVPEGTTQ